MNREEWPVDFESVRLEQLRGWMTATPAQKLQWLEDALKFAYSVGALKVVTRDETRSED
jgi:hypothetical protein